MTLVNLNGTKCTNNTVYITEPSTVAFNCTYEVDESPPGATNYTWSMDGSPLPDTSNVAYIHIPGGSHNVTCTANVSIQDILPGADHDPRCVCNESRSYDVIVVGT